MDTTFSFIDPVSKDTVVVTSGRSEVAFPWIDPETGVRDGEFLRHRYGVIVRTGHGIEYTHEFLGEDSATGALEAARLAFRVAAKVAVVGVEAGLADGHWGNRIIYGSQAYIDEEPFIVEREKSDDLMFG